MNSQQFNHDRQAPSYDRNVKDESNPIRTGYADALTQVAAAVNQANPQRVTDLGAGTGNLAIQINAPELELVDISSRMLAVAATKLHRPVTVKIEDIESHLNGVSNTRSFASSYAFHHLTDSAKIACIRKMVDRLGPTDVICMADLMFANGNEKQRVVQKLETAGAIDIRQAVDEEFFWDIKNVSARLAASGIRPHWNQISDLTWIMTIHPKRRKWPLSDLNRYSLA